MTPTSTSSCHTTMTGLVHAVRPVLHTGARVLSATVRTFTLAICTFVPVAHAANVVQISAGTGHSAAIDSSNTLWLWGANTSGQLGNGTTSPNRIPFQIGTGYAQVSAGHDHTLAIKTDGTLWAWGANEYGQLGNGSFAASTVPVQIGSGFKQVSAAKAFSVALKTDGSVWTWGTNAVGQLGNGTRNICQFTGCPMDFYSGANQPVQIATGFTAVSANSGTSHTVALKADGTVWAWGLAESGQIGNGSTGMSTNSPTQVLANAAKISAGRSASFAIKTDGTLWAWGSNSSSQLGTGSTNTNERLPVQVGTGFSDISAGGNVRVIVGLSDSFQGDTNTHTLALKTDGTLWAWGENRYGQLGNGAGGLGTAQTSTTVTTPTQVGTGFTRISAGGSHSLAVKTDGTLWAWGSNTIAQTGLGLATLSTMNADQHTPQSVVLGNTVSGGLSGQGSLSNLTLGAQLRPLAASLGQAGHAFLVAALPNGALFAFTGTTWMPFDPASPAEWKAILSCLRTSCVPQTAALFNNLDTTALHGTVFFLGYGFGATTAASVREMLEAGRFKLGYSLN